MKRVEDQVRAKHSFVVRMVRTKDEYADVVRYYAENERCQSLYLPLKMVKNTRIVHIHVMFTEPFFADEKA